MKPIECYTIEQIRKALQATYRYAKNDGVEPSIFYFAGYLAGGRITAEEIREEEIIE